MSDHKIQNKKEELANTVTHAIGFLMALVLVPMLVYRAYSKVNFTIVYASLVFSFGFLMAYLSSTLYHMVQQPNAKKALRVWDHISIFFLIGGTYTPIICMYTDSQTTALFLSVMWFLIIVGSLLKLFFTGRYDKVSTAIYILLGWMAIVVIKSLMANMPLSIFGWILGGGLAYTFGIIFYKWRSLTYQHSIWHVFVLAGTLLQYVAIYKSLEP